MQFNYLSLKMAHHQKQLNSTWGGNVLQMTMACVWINRMAYPTHLYASVYWCTTGGTCPDSDHEQHVVMCRQMQGLR
jgi:hypothetical protein